MQQPKIRLWRPSFRGRLIGFQCPKLIFIHAGVVTFQTYESVISPSQISIAKPPWRPLKGTRLSGPTAPTKCDQHRMGLCFAKRTVLLGLKDASLPRSGDVVAVGRRGGSWESRLTAYGVPHTGDREMLSVFQRIFS